MLRKVFRGLLIGLLVILMMAVFATPVLAFDVRSGQLVTVPAGEVVEGDLYVAGSNIIIDGTVNGDIFGAGQTLTINGKINGGVSLAGQTITLNGDISNGARIAGQSITVNGNIGRDLVVAGSDLIINSQSTISGDLVLGVQNAMVNGSINGNIKGSANDATITSGVGGNIDLEVNNLTITSNAKIQGNLTYTSKNQAVIQSGAAINGATTRKLPKPATTRRALPMLAGASVMWQFLGFLMIFIIGIIIILIASRRVTAMANSVQSHPWQSLGWGAVILIVAPIAAIIVMITVIGIPLGIISLVLWGIAIYLSQLPVALLIGRLIIKQNQELESKGLMIGALALGLFLLLVLRLIPFIGWVVGLLTVVFGLGTLITAARRTPEIAG